MNIWWEYWEYQSKPRSVPTWLVGYIDCSATKTETKTNSRKMQSAAMLIESLRSNKYLYTDLEDMYLGIVKHGQDTEMMIKELSDTLNLHK